MGERELAAERNEADAEVQRLRTVNAALLEALEELTICCRAETPQGNKAFDQAHAAIALAKGKKP